MTLWELMGHYQAEFSCPEIIGRLPVKNIKDLCPFAITKYFGNQQQVEDDFYNCISNLDKLCLSEVEPYLVFERTEKGLTLKATFDY